MKRLIITALALLLSCLVLACAEPNVDRSKEYTCGDYRYSPITESVQSTVIDASGNIATVTTNEVVGAMITKYTGSDEALGAGRYQGHSHIKHCVLFLPQSANRVCPGRSDVYWRECLLELR